MHATETLNPNPRIHTKYIIELTKGMMLLIERGIDEK